jgi:hypothetical protein
MTELHSVRVELSAQIRTLGVSVASNGPLTFGFATMGWRK